MTMHGVKSYLKSISLGNLSTADDNQMEEELSVYSARPTIKNDKHNLSSTNEQMREMRQKLKEFSDSLVSGSNDNYDVPPSLPESHLNILQQINEKRDIYQQQSAIWELLLTEQNFLKQIYFIVHVYLTALEVLQPDFFPTINTSDLFGNIKEIYQVSLNFWRKCMQPVIINFTENGKYFHPTFLRKGFEEIGDILQPYILYCTEISVCREHILQLEKGNDLFSEYTKWAMEFEESNREMLCDHLAKPFLRLTKYKILLQAIYKYSDDKGKLDIQEMINAVNMFVTKVNEKVEERNLQRKISFISSQIESYEVLEPLGDDLLVVVNMYNKFDITLPIKIGENEVIRQLIQQGEFKMRESATKAVDVKLLLFTDILLITKCKKKCFNKYKVVKPPINLMHLQVRRFNSNAFVCVVLNEFNCLSFLYHLSHSEPKKMDEFVQKIEEAKKIRTSLSSTHENIPQVHIVSSSPQQNQCRQKPQSNSESQKVDLNVEHSFKRQPPVSKRQRSKNSDPVPNKSSVCASRKNSLPNNSIPKNTNSLNFESRNKSNLLNVDRHFSGESDIDDPPEIYRQSSTLDINGELYKSLNPLHISNLLITDNRQNVKAGNKKSTIIKEMTSSLRFVHDGKLDRKISISLNRLDVE